MRSDELMNTNISCKTCRGFCHIRDMINTNTQIIDPFYFVMVNSTFLLPLTFNWRVDLILTGHHSLTCLL